MVCMLQCIHIVVLSRGLELKPVQENTLFCCHRQWRLTHCLWNTSCQSLPVLKSLFEGKERWEQWRKSPRLSNKVHTYIHGEKIILAVEKTWRVSNKSPPLLMGESMGLFWSTRTADLTTSKGDLIFFLLLIKLLKIELVCSDRWCLSWALQRFHWMTFNINKQYSKWGLASWQCCGWPETDSCHVHYSCYWTNGKWCQCYQPQ